jgi:hypothetical protein
MNSCHLFASVTEFHINTQHNHIVRRGMVVDLGNHEANEGIKKKIGK